MGIFGMNKAIESIQREINNSEYSKTKKELRENAMTTLIIFENVIKELLHIYSFLLYGCNYKEKLYKFKHKKVMLGDAINYCLELNKELEKLNNKQVIKDNIGRNYLIFDGRSDKNFKQSREISQIRGKIIHDDIQEIDSLDQYKIKIYDVMQKCKDVLQDFNNNNIFPRLVEVRSITEENQSLIINFIDEIGSTIPANVTTKNKYTVINNQVYLLKGNKKDKIIPTNIKINHLYNDTMNQNYIEVDVSEEEIDKEFYLEVSDRDEKIVLSNKKELGRHLNNDIIFKQKSISRRQCIIEVDRKHVYLYDLGSTFGTFINGKKIDPYKKYELFENDIISIGVKDETVIITLKNKN